MNTVKKILQFIAKLFHLIYFFIRELVYLKVYLIYRSDIKSIRYKSRKCAVLGNSPSLKIELDKYKDEMKDYDIFCVNSFVSTEEFLAIKPKYLLFLDPLYFVENVSSEIEILRDREFFILYEKVDWDLTLFVNAIANDNLEFLKIVSNKKIKIIYMKYLPYNSFSSFKHFLYKYDLATPRTSNVIVRALFIAINMNYKNIELFGVEHNWIHNLLVDENNIVRIKDNHFYDDYNHYKPYFKGNDKNDTFKMHEILNLYSKMFFGYHEIKDYANYRQVIIINNSVHSFIDAFEKTKKNKNCVL